MAKGEIAHFEQFHFLPQSFLKVFFFFECVKMSIYGGKGQNDVCSFYQYIKMSKFSNGFIQFSLIPLQFYQSVNMYSLKLDQSKIKTMIYGGRLNPRVRSKWKQTFLVVKK